jgi:hypothetical protein
MLASAVLADLFIISGRGTVVLLEEFDGQAKVGDLLRLGPNTCEIIGVEMVAFRDAEAAEHNRRLRRFGCLVIGCTLEQLEAHKGLRVQVESATT